MTKEASKNSSQKVLDKEEDDERDFLVIHESVSFDEGDDDEGDDELPSCSAETTVRVTTNLIQPQKLGRYRRNLGWMLLHFFCLFIYLLPMLLPHAFHQGRPVLDEMHLTAAEHHDVNSPSATLAEIFTNDYWGRPMNATNSHKSWRPLSVLSFRHLKGGRLFKDLMAHRLVNVITHAAVAELVGLLAVKMLPTHVNPTLLRLFTKLLFALHPTHVEVTANAANRPHLFAVLASVLLCDADLHPLLFLVALVCGYLSCETFLFQVPAAGVTLAGLVYIQLYHGPKQLRQRKSLWKQLLTVLNIVWWRLLLLIASGFAYYAFRHSRDWLSIPEGLIRPAENPFYEFVGEERFRNYLFVVAIHILKSWDLDIIGFSHEYGRACIKPLDDWNDFRMAIPAALIASFALILLVLLFQQRRRSVLSMSLILYLVHLAWMVTLFPISGIVKVGTFIADRVVVASTVSICILVANGLSSWVSVRARKTTRWKLIVLGMVGLFMWLRIHRRTIDWMDSKMLLESSLKTCPRFAKAHLETSKIYSGLYPQLLNVTKSRWHLQQVEQIDPDFCDVHQQFAYVAIQENNHDEFETRLAKSLFCPFTMGASVPMWQSYWEQTLRQSTPETITAAQARYEEYMKDINRAMREAEAQEGVAKQSSSPLVAWKR
ncbi:hypothetical protein MPSEU_000106500 [Mayamaea pseudoterrestris]|nr:hypothetical protein MPSEU_000106500 [Mayamaea pseudoterrestris]